MMRIPAILLLGLLLQERRPDEAVVVPNSKVTFDLAYIPGGTFRMGSPDNEPGRAPDEGPVREVKVGPFWLATQEVTWGQFDEYFDAKPPAGVDSWTTPTKAKSYLGQVGLPADFTEPKRPVTNLRLHSAMAYCDWLSKKTGHYYRLPTEAEWEFAARAGSTGASLESLDDHAWHKGNSKEKTKEGKQKKPNAFGLYDILGNVWEYCLEPYAPPEYGPVVRGGAWNTPASELRFANRQTIPQEWFEDDPNRPRSVWWLTAYFSQGLRPLRVEGAATKEELAAYAPKVKIAFSKYDPEKDEKSVKVGTSSSLFAHVKGTVQNGGDRAIAELELTLCFLDGSGKPHPVDLIGANKAGQATWAKVYPALPASAREGDHRKPLKPGESRAFEAYLPQTFDSPPDVDPEKFGGRVTGLRFEK